MKDKPMKVLKIVQKYHPSVTRVVDALRPITIEVEERDDKGSTPLSPSKCALAKACLRSFDGALISVGTAYMIKGTTATRYVVPASIAREIVTFDRHSDFSAGTYRLAAPGGTKKLGAERAERKKTGAGNGKPRAFHYTKGIRKL